MKVYNFEQNSKEWWEIRNGKPSASKAGCIVTMKGGRSDQIKSYSIELANDLFCGKKTSDFKGNSYTERGKELESEARLSYEMSYQKEIKEVGIFTDDLCTYCASPDGILDNANIEIKCLSATKHTEILINFKKNNKCPSTYFCQVQMQLMTSENDYCDLYFYHPDLPCLKIKVENDFKFQRKLKNEIIFLNLKVKEILGILNEYK